MGIFEAAHGCVYVCVKGGGGVGGGSGQKVPLPKICHTFLQDETWHSYVLPKEDPKNI